MFVRLIMSYKSRDERLQWAGLNGESVVIDLRDLSIEYFPFEWPEDQGFKGNLVNDISTSVLHSPIRDVLSLQPDQIATNFELTILSG